MLHKEFCDKYYQGLISVSIEKNRAGELFKSPGFLPNKICLEQAIYRTLAFGLMIAGAVLFFFFPWPVPVAIFVFGCAVCRVCQSKAAEGALKAALFDPYVYAELVERRVLIIREKK